MKCKGNICLITTVFVVIAALVISVIIRNFDDLNVNLSPNHNSDVTQKDSLNKVDKGLNNKDVIQHQNDEGIDNIDLSENDYVINEIIDDSNKKLAEASFLIGVKKYDKKNFPKFEYLSGKLHSAPTIELIDYFLNCGLNSNFFIHDDTNLGIKRMLVSSPTLQEIFKRENFVESCLEIYSEDVFDIDLVDPDKVLKPGDWDRFVENYGKRAIGKLPPIPSKLSFALGKIATTVHFRNQLLMYPDFFKKLKGNEMDILFAVVKNQRAILAANKKYYERNGEYCYRAAHTSGRELALKLVNEIDPSIHYKLSQIKSVDDFIKSLSETFYGGEGN